MKTLNLGAGNRILTDAVNHDLHAHRREIDVVYDLNVLPWPWGDDSFDAIVTWSVFEHLDVDLLTAIDECWRILVSDGQLSIKLPYWQHEMSYNDPTHRYVVGLGIFDTFDPDILKGQQMHFYTERKWQLLSIMQTNSSVYGELRKRD